MMLLVSCSLSFAQKVERDYFKGSQHFVETEWGDIEDDKDGRDFFVMLHAVRIDTTGMGGKLKEPTSYFVTFQPYSYGTFSFSEGSKLLIKNMNDSVMTKTCTKAYPTQSQFVQIFFVPATRYYASVVYMVSEDELNTLITDGVKKLRFQVTGETFEKEYKKDKIGKFLKKAKKNIDEALEKQKSFESGFDESDF